MGKDFERDDEEIVRYYERVRPADTFGIWGTELLIRLPLHKASPFMAKDHGWNTDTWTKAFRKKDSESILQEIEDFFQFAWEKSIFHHGVAASMTIHHYLAWFWLNGDMELFKYAMNPKNFCNYGCPVLLAIAQKYDLMDLLPDKPRWREVFMNMAAGKPCSQFICPGGCGEGNPQQYRPMNLLVPPNGQMIHPKLPS